MDLLAVPAITTANEREFSIADDGINNKRPRLSEELAEDRQCLRSWVLCGLVDLATVRSIQLTGVLIS